MKQITIATSRLRLRALAAADLALFRDLYTDAEVMRFIARPLSAAEATASFWATLQATGRPHGPWFFAIVEKRVMLGGVGVDTGTIPSKTFREAVLSFSRASQPFDQGSTAHQDGLDLDLHACFSFLVFGR